VESATQSLRAEKEAADALASTRQEQITSLTADLEKSKKDVEMKHSIGIRWKARADTLTQEARTRQTTLEEKEKAVAELTTKVEGLTKELEGSKAKIGELEKKAVTPAPAAAAVATPTSAEVPADSAELVSLFTSVEIGADM
jgi:nucleoprotein TPR